MRTEIESILAGKSGEVYQSVVAGLDAYPKPHEFISLAYSTYLDIHGSNRSVNGWMLEYLICETLKREGIIPFYFQAKFKLVPNVDFDVVCYHPTAPVVLSSKVSLRERYKQAVLEGFILGQVYRNSRTYLITLSDEQARERRKLLAGEIVGLADIIRADSPDYDDLLDDLKQQTFTLADRIVPLEGKLIAGNGPDK